MKSVLKFGNVPTYYFLDCSHFHYEKFRSFNWFPVRKFWETAQFPHSFGRFAQNFHPKKLGEITVFFAELANIKNVTTNFFILSCWTKWSYFES